jgi:small subunit ribosomal protein S17
MADETTPEAADSGLPAADAEPKSDTARPSPDEDVEAAEGSGPADVPAVTATEQPAAPETAEAPAATATEEPAAAETAEAPADVPVATATDEPAAPETAEAHAEPAAPVSTSDPVRAPAASTGRAGATSTVTDRSNRRKVREGLVVSVKMDSTAVIGVIERVRHPRYAKTVQRTKRLYAHDPANDLRVGDRVRVAETRPLSRLKRWRVVEVLERAK